MPGHPVRRSLTLLLIPLCSLAPVSAAGASPMSGEGWPALAGDVDAIVQSFIDEHDLPGLTVAISKDGRVVLDKGYGYADLGAAQPMEPHHRSRIGSSSKVITALAVMRMAQAENPFDPSDFSLLDEPVYPLGGLLAQSGHPDPLLFWLYLAQGQRRHTPVVGTVIRKSDDRVFTFYDDDTYSAGTTSKLAEHQEPQPYTLPPGQTSRDIRGMAAHPSGWIYTWYRDKSLSLGTVQDLDSALYFDSSLEGFDGVDLPPGQSMDRLVGIGITSEGLISSWWEDGTRSVGAGLDLASESSGQQYSAGGARTPWELRSMAIAGNDHVYAFFGGNIVTSGTSLLLDAHRPPYDTELPASVAPEPWFTWLHQVTLRHLLSHTSGFIDNGSASAAASMFELPGTHDVGMERVHQHALRALPMLYPPGEGSLYSNHGIGVAGWVLEQHTGMAFKDYVDDVLLAPLDIELGRVWEPLTVDDARPHTYDGQGQPVPCTCAPSMHFGEGRGGLTASAGDLARLMLATDGRIGRTEHPDVVTSTSLAEMETSHFLPVTRRALGWGKDLGGKLSHTGKLWGGRSGMAKYPVGYDVNGIEVGDVHVAVVINIRTDANVQALMDSLAEAAGSASISAGYDLY